MNYKCLVLDHDDTIVESTRQILYPAFVEYLRIVRPNITMSFEEYMRGNFNPGFSELCFKKLNFTDAEMKEEVEFWKEYVKKHIPRCYEGIKEILQRYKKKGGIICVVSHSLAENILRDYEENELPKPDMIFGWERPQSQRKPSTYSIEQILKQFDLKSSELLMVDDLKPGCDMAKNSGIDFAAASWAYNIPEIQEYMKANSNYYLEKVEDLKNIIL